MSSIGFGRCESDDGTVLDAVVELLAADPAQCGRDGLTSLTRRTLRVRSWLDALEAGIAARAARLAAVGESADAATVLAGGGRRSRRDAEAAAARGDVCARMPAFAEALSGGGITAGHVDAVVAAARGLDEAGKARLAEHAEVLVAAAATLPPERLEREAKDLARDLSGDDGLSRHEQLRRERNVRRWVDKHTGMCKTLLSLDPLADATVWTAIGSAVAAARTRDQRDDDRSWDQLQADVVVELITGARSGGDGDGRPVPEVSVLIDYATLRNGVHEGSVGETSDGRPLPVATLRRLCCEADIVPIVLGGDGEVLDVGRQCRVANRAQRRALRAMYRGCAHPQCTVGFEACRIHHVTYWFNGGRSDLDNLLPLCETHHHLVHEGGWTIILHPDRRTTWRTPDGTVYFDGITTDRRSPPSEAETRSLATCRQRRRRHPPTTVAEIAADLAEALDEVRRRGDRSARATSLSDDGRGPPHP